MGVAEWVSLATFIFALIGMLIKVASDKTEMMNKIKVLETWKEKLEGSNLVTEKRFMDDRNSYRMEINKDIARIENRLSDFVRCLELHSERITKMNEDIIKIITILEKERKDNGTAIGF